MNNVNAYQNQIVSAQGQQLANLYSATAGQLQDAARRRYAELKDRADKLDAERTALGKEMEMLATMFPKPQAT